MTKVVIELVLFGFGALTLNTTGDANTASGFFGSTATGIGNAAVGFL
jgi:hypothetical protein